MWPFTYRRSPSSSTRGSRPSFKPIVDALEDRTLLSHTINIPVPINSQVLAFAQSHVNKVVGNGQCATLAQDAVQSANGVPFYQLGPSGSNADYVWGKLVDTLTPANGNTAAIAPGDILQFSNVTEVDTMTIRYANGRTSTTVSTQSPAHHTAIVSAVGGNARNDLQVLQANVQLSQNEPLSMQQADQGGMYWGGTSTVTTNYPQYGFSITVTHAMTSGVIKVYQPYTNVAIRLPF